jgi:ferredoxin
MTVKYLANVSTLKLTESLCNGCGACAEVCPHGVLAVEGGKARITDPDLCMECGACARNCTERALFVRSGVGCAGAIIGGMLGRKGSECCCSVDDGKNICC